MAVVKLCDSVSVAVEVKEEVLFSDKVYPYMEQSEPVRIGEVKTPFMLHVITEMGDNPCPMLLIERVVKCPNGCEIDEYKYAFPCECTSDYLLPSGIYDITVCKQGVANKKAGDTVNISFMIEPVDDSFAAIYTGKVA